MSSIAADAAREALRLHHIGVEATASGRPAVGARHLRTGLRLLGWADPRTPTAEPGTGHAPGHNAIAGRLLISLAHAEAEQGRTSYGFTLLDRATTLADRDDHPVLLQQRGLMLLRTGQRDEALACLDEAVELLSTVDNVAVLARTLLNRGQAQLEAGRLRTARADLERCIRVAASNNLDMLAAKASHNLGLCDMLAGDIPAALAAFAVTERACEKYGPTNLPVVLDARARALLAVGLADEAIRELDRAIESLRRQRLDQDLAEAELTRAHAALLSGDLPGAAMWAVHARRRFQRRPNHVWAALAALMQLRAEYPGPRSKVAYATRATRLAGRLRVLGLADDAELADLLATRALIAAGHLDDATGRARAWRRRAAPLETLLMRRLAAAELATATQDRRRALREIRAGLTTLHQHRSRLGSLDLRVGIATLGRQLAETGLAMALERGSPRTIFTWAERARAQAFRIRPARPPVDPATTDMLAELRQLMQAQRTAELAGAPEPGLRVRCARLERELTLREWQTAGSGATQALTEPGILLARLAAAGWIMVSLLNVGERLLTLILRDGSIRMIQLGDYPTVAATARRLLADLDALAGRALPARLQSTIHGSVERQLTILNETILMPLRHALGDQPVVIVPTQGLSAVPWGLLPDLRGRPMSVCASGAAWLAAHHAWLDNRRATGRPLLVAGPGLAHADAEIGGIAGSYPTARRLTGDAATVAATLDGLDGAPIAHLAAHGHHGYENALFSRLDLVDGPLMAYDLPLLSEPPRQVTLSACALGRATVRAGDEILGFTAALLYAGTANVISSVAQVDDHAAATVMAAYHRGITAGAPPAAALATASMAAPLAPFVCFGAS